MSMMQVRVISTLSTRWTSDPLFLINSLKMASWWRNMQELVP